MKTIVELIIIFVTISMLGWWIISANHRRNVKGVIHWKDGRITESTQIFKNLAEFEDWFIHMTSKYRRKIDFIEYSFISKKK